MFSLTVKKQALTYVYDLKNEANEHGFKAEDRWTLNLVSDSEKTRIQREYYPAVVSKVSKDVLLDVFQTIKLEMQQSLTSEEELMDIKSVLNSELNYIIAYNPKRQR